MSKCSVYPLPRNSDSRYKASPSAVGDARGTFRGGSRGAATPERCANIGRTTPAPRRVSDFGFAATLCKSTLCAAESTLSWAPRSARQRCPTLDCPMSKHRERPGASEVSAGIQYPEHYRKSEPLPRRGCPPPVGASPSSSPSSPLEGQQGYRHEWHRGCARSATAGPA